MVVRSSSGCRRRLAVCGLLALLGCPGDDGLGAAGGTGGDDEMPDDPTPGPNGPSCVPPRSGAVPDEPASRSQPGRRSRTARLDGGVGEVTAPHEPLHATTFDPHVHERWDEARKLELAYCINRVSGDDAEREANYHKLIRSLASATAEWERVSDVNFIHLRHDDEPEETPYLTPTKRGVRVDAARCAAGTNAYFGVVAGFDTASKDGSTNFTPELWNAPELEPLGSDGIARVLQVNSQHVEGFGDLQLLSTLRHELGHVMGFDHEEASLPNPPDRCNSPNPRSLTPIDSVSIMGTPDCKGLARVDYLSARDRLSAFFLHHTPRSRFEVRTAGTATGYRFGGGVAGTGAEILWHSAGAMEGVRWRPQGGAGISFTAEPYPYVPPGTLLPEDWYPTQSEVVIPLRLGGDAERVDLLFFGPGPDVNDFAVLTAGNEPTVLPWEGDGFAVPVVGSFDPDALDRDLVYLYRPGPDSDMGLGVVDGSVVLLEDVPQQDAYAYPLAAPYRGDGFPDDVIWLDPHARQLITWRWTTGTLDGLSISVSPQSALSLPSGELTPVVGDFNGDGRADVMWHGVANLPGLENTTDVLWLSESVETLLSFIVVDKAVGTGYRPFVGDFDGDGRDDVFWQRQWGMTSTGPSESETGPSFVWYFDEAGGHEAKAYVLGADRSPYVGDFDADGCHDIGWFDATDDALYVWRCLPGARDFDCEETMTTPPSSAPVGVHWGF